VRAVAESTAPVRVIRDAEFAKRLTLASDGHPMVPPLHSGRLTWVVRELKSRFDEDISVETARKWFHGEAKPRPDKVAKLAQLLEVDVGWLSLGIDATMQPRERKIRNAIADGAVNVVAGLIQMDGGYPAFPTEAETVVDLHAIIKGAKYDFHVSSGVIDGRQIEFSVPRECGPSVLVLGVIKRGFNIEIAEIPGELIETATRRGATATVTMTEAEFKKHRIESFAKRL